MEAKTTVGASPLANMGVPTTVATLPLASKKVSARILATICQKSYICPNQTYTTVQKNLLLLLFLLAPVLASAGGAKQPFYFAALTTADGLSQNSIFTICQDSEGYLWFGTENGLNRYDGYTFSTYPTTRLDTAALSPGRIELVAEDARKQLWAKTEFGLSRIDLLTGKAHRHPLNPTERTIALLPHPRHGMLLVTDRHLYALSPHGYRTLTPATHPLRFTAATLDARHALYLATARHGILVVQADGSAAPYPGSQNLGTLHLLHIDSEQRLWAAAHQRPIVRSPRPGTPFTPIPAEAHNAIDKSLRAVIDLDTRHLLLGTFNGLFLLDKHTGEARPAARNTGAPGELSHFSIYSLCRDRQGTLWVGTNLGGVNYHHALNNRFGFVAPTRFSGIISQAAEDAAGRLWLATEGGGLLALDTATGAQHNFLPRQEKPSFNRNILKALCIRGDSILCSTHRGEVFLFSIRRRQFSLLRDYGENNIPALMCDRSGTLWIATYMNKGLVRVSPGGEESNRLRVDGRETTLHLVSALYETAAGEVLIGTRHQSFYRYDPRRGEARQVGAAQLGLPADATVCVQALMEDAGGNLWVLTRDQGIIVLGKDFRPLVPQPSPLPGGEMLHISESPQGYFWLADRHRIYRLHPASHTLQGFDHRNGVVPQEFSPTPGLLGSGGMLYLCGNRGINTVDTRRFKTNTVPPPVVLTTLSINNRRVEPDGEHPRYALPLKAMKELTLRHDETNLVIGYTALNFIHPQSNRYRYRLEGIDAGWVEAGERREAIYSNLPAGRYVLHVRAANNDGIWNGQEAVLPIRVLPPLWLRWWALAGYGLCLLLAVQRGVCHLRKKHLLENELRLNRLRQEQSEEMHRERLRLFAHIAHEIRTPLMLLVNPVQEIATKTRHISGMEEIHARIERNTQRLLNLVDGLLEIQKGEAGRATLTAQPFDLGGLLEEMAGNFSPIAEKRGIGFGVERPAAGLVVVYDRGELEKAVGNLLWNALKFTPARGRVTLRAVVEAETLRIEVEDTGIGMSGEEKKRVFEPFALSRKDIHGELPGSGIGLSMTRYIVEQHGGTVGVEDGSEGGTVVCIRLPYRPAEGLREGNSVEEGSAAEAGALPQVAGGTDAAAVASPALAITSAPTRYKLLIIDDNEEIGAYLQEQLRHAYRVKTATDGASALRMLESEGFDLVVSDVMMPAPDGLELCRIVKNSPELCHIPIILLTAKAMSVHLEEGYQAGADDYLVKPFKISTLEARIGNLLAERKRLREVYGKRLSVESAGIVAEPAEREFVERYIGLVKQNISVPEFDIESLARELGMSRAAFYRKVKAVSNLSPAEMIRNIRLECAAELLKESGQSANVVSFQVGFKSYSHFCNCFKGVYGISPAKFKEKYS